MSAILFRPKSQDNKAVRHEPIHKVYERAIDRFIISHTGLKNWSRDDYKKLIYLEVKYIEAIYIEYEGGSDSAFIKKTPMEKFNLMDVIVNTIGILNPVELTELFPVRKFYDGGKYQMKDYYNTMEALHRLNKEEPIGTGVYSLLWDYDNCSITSFMVHFIEIINIVGVYRGAPDALDVIFTNSENSKRIERNKFAVIQGGLK